MVKLKSGREVELKPLTFRQKLRLTDTSFNLFQETGRGWSFESMLDIVQMATGLSDKEMEDWEVSELDECAAEIIKDNTLSEFDKKK